MLLFGKKMKTWYDSEYKKAELITKTINLHFE